MGYSKSNFESYKVEIFLLKKKKFFEFKTITQSKRWWQSTYFLEIRFLVGGSKQVNLIELPKQQTIRFRFKTNI